MRSNQNHSPNGKPSAPNTRGRATQHPRNSPAEQRNIRDYFLMIRERWFLGFAAAVVLVGALAFMQLRQEPIYEARASLLFEPSMITVVDIEQVVDNSLQSGGAADMRLQTHIGQMRSNSFFTYVAESFTDEETEKILAPYIQPESETPSLGGVVYPGIGIVLNRGTYLLTVTSRHRDPKMAVLIADRYAQKYIDFNRDRTSASNLEAREFLGDRAKELKLQVQKSEDGLNEYRRSHNLISLEENQNIILRHLNALSTSVVEARVTRLALDSEMDQVDNYVDSHENLVEIDFISDYGSVGKLRSELNDLLSQRTLLDQKYLENHPQMIKIQSSIESIRELLLENIEMAVTELRSRHRRALQHEARLEEELAKAEKNSLELEEVAVGYNVLQRQVNSDRDAYAGIIDRVNETNISSQLDNVNIKFADAATMPYLPVEPDLKKVILQSAFLGCFIFIGLPLGLGILDNKLKAAWEVELLLGLPMLGEIPRLSGIKKKDRPHLIAQKKDHAAGEAFRGIFSQIQLSSPLDLPRIIMITSTVPGEGKSMVSSNLAATFAAHGKRTLLVDCDFRRPSLNRLYDQKNDHGIMTWLQTGEERPGALEENKQLQIVPISNNLHLLRAGGESRNPTEMFDHPSFRALFEEFKTDFDVIILDTPPVGIFPDALLLAQMCDQILYVTQFNRVNKTQIRKFTEKVESAQVEMGGIILNGIPSGRNAAYYDYYGYGHVGNKEYKAYYSQKR